MTISISATCFAIAVLFCEYGIVSGQGTSADSGSNFQVRTPWHALVYRNEKQGMQTTSRYVCGATIIRSDLVLTAAHCVYDDDKGTVEPVERLHVRVAQEHKVKKIHVQCEYMGAIDYYALDIAILELDPPFNFSRAISPAVLYKNLVDDRAMLDDDGSFAKVASFGKITEGKSSDRLHIITVPYIEPDQCRRFTDIPYYNETDKFCVGCSNETLHNGDGGSGLVLQRGGIWYLRGIVSIALGAESENGEEKCHDRFYVLNTDMSFHWQWMIDVVARINTTLVHRNCSDQRPPETFTPKRIISIDSEGKVTNEEIPLSGSSSGGGYGGGIAGGVAGGGSGYGGGGGGSGYGGGGGGYSGFGGSSYNVSSLGVAQENCTEMYIEKNTQQGSPQKCSLLTSLCFGNTCLRRLFPCNDVFASAILSQQNRKVCIPNTMASGLTANDQRNADIFCSVPLKTQNSTWEAFDCREPQVCKLAPERRFKPGDRVSVQCDKGYKPTEATTVGCGNNGAWFNVPKCTAIRCPQLTSYSTRAVCTLFGNLVSCDSEAEISTKARVSCNNAYQRSSDSYTTQREDVTCGSEGKWVPDPIQCIPVCGLIATRIKPLIAGGRRADISSVPWHATLYKSDNENLPKEFICGGTIIRWNMILTAAHCVHDETIRKVEPANKFSVAAGNLRRNYNDPKNNRHWIQKSEVKNVFVECDYLGANGNYDLDIAVLELTEGFTFTAVLRPICLDWSSDMQGLDVGDEGVIAGFGRYAKESDASTNLQTATLPYVSDEECRRSVGIAKLRRLKTRGKFCAGYNNGTAVCPGDSGGGLVFKIGDLWYLQGIVSTSVGVDLPTAESCDTSSYSLYTRVSEHIKWIQDVTQYLDKRLLLQSCIRGSQ